MFHVTNPSGSAFNGVAYSNPETLVMGDMFTEIHCFHFNTVTGIHCVTGPEILTGTGTKAGNRNMTGPGPVLRPGSEIRQDRDRDQEPGLVLVWDWYRDRGHDQQGENNL